MRRAVSLILVIILMAVTACAEGSYIGEMLVVNCEDWVSLREYPDSSADRLIKVPLGATVTNCRWESTDYIYAEYNGWSGYIMSQYLMQAANGGYIGTMQVVNCEDWVSLRKYPDSSADRLIKVPLGATVTDCRWESADYIYAEYNGWGGYIMSKYLSGGSASGTMRIANCNEWVSLREYPDSASDRLIKVPLGAIVNNCYRENAQFYYCEYNGWGGYILAEYLIGTGGYAVDAVSSASLSY